MKKKLFLMFFITVISIGVLVSGEFDERVWVYNGEQAITINLEKTFYLPKYETEWKSAATPSLENGTYVTKQSQVNNNPENVNGIGNIGSAYCSHLITFTVSTTGQFVSQSDPSKYRDFYVALKPRIREIDPYDKNGALKNPDGSGNDRDYYYTDPNGSPHSGSERVPNSRDNGLTFSVTAPALTQVAEKVGGKNTWVLEEEKKTDSGHDGLGYNEDGMIYASRVYYDILICLDPITSQDRIHMSELDDYVALINFSWTCGVAGCNKNHSGSYTFVVRGYYGSSSGSSEANDNVFLIVSPEATASHLDIIKMIDNEAHSGSEKIAKLQVITTVLKYDKGKNMYNDWNNRVKVFISSSNNYASSGDHFALTRYRGGSAVEIPFQIKVYNEGTNTVNKNYDGTDSWPASKSNCLSFTVQNYNGREGTATKGLEYKGDVVLEITDVPDEDGKYIVDKRNDYVGQYYEDIYFHIVYDDPNSQ